MGRRKSGKKPLMLTTKPIAKDHIDDPPLVNSGFKGLLLAFVNFLSFLLVGSKSVKEFSDVHVKGTPFEFHERTIRSQCYQSSLKVTRIENIIHPDLKKRFEKHWTKRPHLKLKMVYHGTCAHNYRSILERGLIVPGSNGVRVVNGSAYGVGIYLGANPGISIGYARGEYKLFVCALLDDPSHVSFHSTCYVAKKEDVVLPCYVVYFSGYAGNCYHSPTSQFFTNLYLYLRPLIVMGTWINFGIYCYIGYYFGWEHVKELMWVELGFVWDIVCTIASYLWFAMWWVATSVWALTCMVGGLMWNMACWTVGMMQNISVTLSELRVHTSL